MVGHGPKVGQNEFACTCISVVFTFLPFRFFFNAIHKTSGTKMYWPAKSSLYILFLDIEKKAEC